MSSKFSSASQDPSQSKLRFEDLHPDIVSEVGRNFPVTVQVVAGRERTESEHVLLKSMQKDSGTGYYWRPNPLRSLVSVSRKLNSLWIPVLMQDVTLSTSQLHSFLSLLLKKPDLTAHVQRLNFQEDPMRFELSEMHRRSRMFNKLKSLDALRPYSGPSEDHLASQDRKSTDSELEAQVVSAARALILEKCSNLKELSFNSDVTFPLSLDSQEMHSVLSTELRSLEMSNASPSYLPGIENRVQWDLNQVVFLSLFLPNLKDATFFFTLNCKDATFIDLHLSTLKTSSLSSKSSSLRLNIQQPEESFGESKIFEATTVVKSLLSLFVGLRRLQVQFLSSPMNIFRALSLLGIVNNSERRPANLPGFEVFDGLKPSSETLEYISIQGLQDEKESGSKEEAERRGEKKRLIMMNFQVLKYLQVEVGILDCLLPGCTSESFALPNSLEIMEVIRSLKGIRKKSTEDAILADLLQRSRVPESLRLVTAPKVLVDEQRKFTASDMEEFQRNRRRLEEASKNLGISLDFV